MAINFTDSPANGATQTISGRTYTYNSAKNKWDTTATEVAGPTATTYATANDLPGTATAGDQAFVSGTNRLYIWNGTGWYNIALINNTPTWTTQPASSYALAIDGTATVVSIVASDPEGVPITYSITSDTSGNVATVVQGTGLNTNSWTITPSTSNADAGTFSLTFRASDGINIASAISSFTLQFKVVNQKYTTALITSVGANNAVNNSFDDKSTSNHTITAAGNATQTTFSPYRHGEYSVEFDGTGDYLETPTDTSSFQVGTGQFTLECWFQVNADAQYTLLALMSGSTNVMNIFYYHTNDSIGIVDSDWLTGNVGSGTNHDIIDLNKWHHLALVRDASTLYLYIDGALKYSASNSTNYANNRIRIGSHQYGNNLNGYIRDVRFVKGTAVYTSAFTAPTEPLTAVTNTKLLTCHLPYIADGSTDGHAITVAGDPTIEPISPYDAQEYSASDHGGSMYFDGTGDYLSVGSSSTNVTLSGDFCIEAWIYRAANTDGAIIGNYLSSPNRGWSFRTSTNSNLLLYFQIDGGSEVSYTTPTGSAPLNQWLHVAWCRYGTTASVFVNGSRVDSRTLSGTSTGAGGLALSVLSQGFASYLVTGHISDARVVNGSYVYDPTQTDLTVPTAPLTAITNTSLLLNGTDAGIIDKAQVIPQIKLVGDVKSSTTQNKFLTSSIKFDDNGDYMIVKPGQEWAFGTGDFTVEYWIYYNAIGNYDYVYDGRNSSQTTGAWSVAHGYSGGNATILQWASGGGVVLTAASNPSTSQWVHIAFCRSGSTLKLFYNGTQNQSATDNTNYSTVLTHSYFGCRHSIEHYLNAYLSDFRVTKGLARYTSNFTAPTAALQG